MGRVNKLLYDIRESVMGYYSHESYKLQSPEMAALEPEVERPEELNLLESLRQLGMRFTEGGYVQQPWLLMKTLEAAENGKSLFLEQQRATIPTKE
jgi:hypothetical protein